MGWNDHFTQRRQASVPWDEHSQQPHAPKDLRDVIEGLVEVTRWDKGFADCLCPSCGRSDGILFYDGRFPVVSCFSTGCADPNRRTNAELVERTKQVCGRRGGKFELTERDKAQIAFRRRLKFGEAQARSRLLPQLLKQSPVELKQWQRESPCPLAEVPVEKH